MCTEQQINNTYLDTLRHIDKVRDCVEIIVKELLTRGRLHDRSKMSSPELEVFAENTKKLSELEYGSEEYDKAKSALADAIVHHYANNNHHPEFHKNGIDDMNLVDIVEMFCDWKAATLRNKNGGMLKSIEVNRTRFNMSDQLVNIFKNSVQLLEN